MTSMKHKLKAVPNSPTLHLYLRRSTDEHQVDSFDIQRDVSRAFVAEVLPDVRWDQRLEYEDSGLAGDDPARPGLQRLKAKVAPGDIVVVREASRLFRDFPKLVELAREFAAVNVTIYDAAKREALKVGTATEQFVTAIGGLGDQMFLESVRTQTKAGIRRNVREGKSAGGRPPYGYRNVPHPVGRRQNTTIEIDQEQASVVVMIFELYANTDLGYASIAKRLNAEGVPAKNDSWKYGTIREMLRNQKYRGVLTHGVTVRSKRGGKRKATKADPSEVMREDRPDLRIIDDELWQRVQARLARSASKASNRGNPTRVGTPRHPLTGLGRCAVCNGPIGIANTKASGGVRVRAYVCKHKDKRGTCDVKVRQRKEVVEAAVFGFLLDRVLDAETMERITARVLELAHEDQADDGVSVATLEARAKKLRAVKKRLVKAIALTDGIDDLVVELQERDEQLRQIERAIAAAETTPVAAKATAEMMAAKVGAIFDRLRAGIVDVPEVARATLREMFPDGIYFHPSKNQTAWTITGNPVIAQTPGICDPTGT